MNIETNKAISRAIELLNIAAYHCEQYAPDAETNYDGTECDGSCLADDCRAAASELKYRQNKENL